MHPLDTTIPYGWHSFGPLGQPMLSQALPERPQPNRRQPQNLFSSVLGNHSGDELYPVESAPDELAAIVFTSGSTGPPKGVCYKNSTLNGQIRMLKENFGMKEGEVDMATLPIFALFNPALGITTVIPEMNPSRPAKAWRPKPR